MKMKMKKIKVNRVRSHIEGFDELISGGFPKGACILLNGDPGSGKTIYSLQYLINGACLESEVGIYFTFEEKRDALIMQASQFGWDLQELEKKGLIKIVSIGVDSIDKDTVNEIMEIIKNLKAKRVVIDSISTLSFLVQSVENYLSEFEITKFLYTFVAKFKEISEVTSLFISQKNSIGSLSSEFICDGIISLESESLGGNYSRNLTVKKMRSTKNNDELHPFEIVDREGIKVHNFN